MEISDYVRLRKAFGRDGADMYGIFKAESRDSLIGLFGVCRVCGDDLPKDSICLLVSALSDNPIFFNEFTFCFDSDIENFQIPQYLAIGLAFFGVQGNILVTDVTEIFDLETWLKKASG